MKLRSLFFCSLLVPLLGGAVEPYIVQKNDPLLEPWRWRAEESLDHLGVISMDQAADGTIWFGNRGSIASYNGKTVSVISFDQPEFAALNWSNNELNVWRLHVFSNGDMLAVIGDDLVHFSNGKWRIILAGLGVGNSNVNLYCEQDGTIWLLAEKCIWKIKSDFSGAVPFLEAEPGKIFLTACVGIDSGLWLVEKTGVTSSQLVYVPWVGNKKGLLLNEKKAFPVPFSGVVQEARIIVDRDGILWYANSSGQIGLQAFDPQTKTWITGPDEYVPENAFSILQYRDGRIMASGEGGLFFYTPGKGQKVYSCQQLGLPRYAYVLYKTADGRLWMLGHGGHVFSVDMGTSEWQTFPGLTLRFEGKDGTLWFTTEDNSHVVSRSSSGEWLAYSRSDHLLDDVFVVFESSHGLIWCAGTYQNRGAVSVFDGVRWRRLRHPEFAHQIYRQSFFEASDRTVWFGAGGALLDGDPSPGGALRFRVKESGEIELIRHYAPPEFPYYVNAFAQGDDETLWIGSTHIFTFNEQAGDVVKEIPLPGDNTAAMAFDADGALWFAKENYGVCRWSEDSRTLFTKKHGLTSLKFADLLVLDDGTVLVASNEGISRYDGRSWASEAYSKQFAMAAWRRGLLQTKDGAIWMNFEQSDEQMQDAVPEFRGACSIRHTPETTPPDTWFVEYAEKISQPGNGYVSWMGSDPWNATRPESLQYSWRLDEGEWSAFSNGTGHMFLSLGSGNHILEVRARDREFNMDPTPARIQFHVIPPVWKQPWFLTMVSFFCGTIGFLTWLLIRNRERHLIEQQAQREISLKREQEEREAHLKEMDRLKTGFFTNISHELRTPVTVVSGRLQTLFSAEGDEKKKKSIGIVLRNAERVSTLITQLLDFRKIEEGKISVDATQGDLIPLLRDWTASLQVLAEQAKISLALDCPDECKGRVDFDKVQKIFTNLISNAIKYTYPGGEVRVILRVEEEKCIRFVVEDTGPGISPEHREHIFDRFYRVSEASMAVGAGIGLNLTKELVDLLGGEISVESPISDDPEHPGTRFTVRLPMLQHAAGDTKPGEESGFEAVGDLSNRGHDDRDKTAPADSVDQSVQPAEDAPLILIVEDDEDIREFIVEGLVDAYRIEIAENGEAGLQKAKEMVPDLIITDVMMPVMDGLQLCHELKTSMETSHIPVVMLTAKASVDSQMDGLKTGADDYVTKPFNMDLLAVRIQNLLKSRELLRERFLKEFSVSGPEEVHDEIHREFLQKVVAVMEEHYMDEFFSVDDFATAMHMSNTSLWRKFKAVLDRTPWEYLLEYRMGKAAEFLKTTDKNITEIALDVGCEYTGNFSRMFKKYYGKSPSAYRADSRES